MESINAFFRSIYNTHEEANSLVREALEYFRLKQEQGFIEGVEECIFRLVLDEAVTNAVEHGNMRDPSKRICVVITPLKNNARITVIDEGDGFGYTGLRNPTHPENKLRYGGRGIYIMKNFGKISWNKQGNCVSVMI
ncbi:MAG: ATP-binding protein [Spirochaetes bacterium]|nr:MAG: ATP-binding protein [Spirochaetota bacterium]